MSGVFGRSGYLIETLPVVVPLTLQMLSAALPCPANHKPMSALHLYTADLQTARAIIQRDGLATRDFMYVKCYPLFKSIFDNYHTDCETVFEFIDEIYTLILMPSPATGRCQLQNYRGESRLSTWLKTVSLFYCYHRYKEKEALPVVRLVACGEDEEEETGDRFLDKSSSTPPDTRSIDHSDVEVIIGLMPNERYRTLIRLRYLECRSNEETAEALGMTMANYYNKHKLAKAQYERVREQENARS